MKILISNDDGIQSIGLQQLCNALSNIGHDIFVVAPDGQRSGFSHSVNFHKTIHVTQIHNYYGAKLAYSCSGTPSDCVKFGLYNVVKDCDLVLCGPNIGENVAYDILYSGTVGAAEEGIMHGVPSIALSRWGAGNNFDASIKYFLKILPSLMKINAKDCVININMPDLPYDKILGIKVAKQGEIIFDDYYVNEGDGNWRLEGDLNLDKENNTDAYYSSKGYVTITPIKIIQTDFEKIENLEDILEV